MREWGGRIRVKTKICFVALYSYSLFNPDTQYLFGGSEVRAWLLARGLARRDDCDVSMVVFDHGQPTMERRDGVAVWKQSHYRSFEMASPVQGQINRLTSWIKGGIELLFPKSPVEAKGHSAPASAFSVFKKIDPDVICILGVTNLTADLAAYCLHSRTRLIILAGSDSNFSPNYREGSQDASTYGNIGHLCHYAISNADAIIAQTQQQARLCWENFNRQASVIANPVDLENALQMPELGRDGPVLWVGKSDLVKQPGLAIKLAEKYPSTPFILVMNKSHPELHADIIKNKPDNVEIIERLTFSDTENLFRSASILINTSVFEGFPNTFLQAGKYGVPIISLSVDPDGFLSRSGCGIFAANDFGAMAESLGTLVNSPRMRTEIGDRVASEVRKRHDLAEKSEQLFQILRDLD